MDWTLLHKYLSGECSPEEMQKVEDWMHVDAGNRKFLSSLRKVWEVKPSDEIEVDAKSAWNTFQQKIAFQTEVDKKQVYKFKKLHLEKPLRKSYSRLIVTGLSAAAVILVAFLFAGQISSGHEVAQSHSQTAMQEVVTSKGQRTIFRLSDGTRVQLNADSKIAIPESYMDSTRKVFLQGEAYFEVVSNPEKPFLVFAKGAYTRVLGTKFGVRAYPEDDRVQVVVAEGKVTLGSDDQVNLSTSKEISRNQIGILSENGQTSISDVHNMRKYLGWKDGELVFEDTPLYEVRTRLERWFDITCTVASSSLDKRRVTASFDDEPMTEVLNVIALAMDLKYKRKGRIIRFQES